MRTKVFIGLLLIVSVLAFSAGFLWAGGYFEEEEARPAHILNKTMSIPRSYGELEAISGQDMYFQASNGTIRIVRQNPRGALVKKVIVINRD